MKKEVGPQYLVSGEQINVPAKAVERPPDERGQVMKLIALYGLDYLRELRSGLLSSGETVQKRRKRQMIVIPEDLELMRARTEKSMDVWTGLDRKMHQLCDNKEEEMRADGNIVTADDLLDDGDREERFINLDPDEIDWDKIREDQEKREKNVENFLLQLAKETLFEIVKIFIDESKVKGLDSDLISKLRIECEKVAIKISHSARIVRKENIREFAPSSEYVILGDNIEVAFSKISRQNHQFCPCLGLRDFGRLLDMFINEMENEVASFKDE